MLLMEALGSGTTYLVDTVDLDGERNVVRLWHCGAAAPPWRRTPRTQRSSPTATARSAWRATSRCARGPSSWPASRRTRHGRAASDSCSPPASPCPSPTASRANTAAVRLDGDATQFVTGLVTGGFPHHTVLAWSDVRPQLRAAADLLGIAVVDW